MAGLESDNSPSLTEYVNESVVVSLPLWIYRILPFPRSIIFPFVGCDDMVNWIALAAVSLSE